MFAHRSGRRARNFAPSSTPSFVKQHHVRLHLPGAPEYVHMPCSPGAAPGPARRSGSTTSGPRSWGRWCASACPSCASAPTSSGAPAAAAVGQRGSASLGTSLKYSKLACACCCTPQSEPVSASGGPGERLHAESGGCAPSVAHRARARAAYTRCTSTASRWRSWRPRWLRRPGGRSPCSPTRRRSAAGSRSCRCPPRRAG